MAEPSRTVAGMLRNEVGILRSLSERIIVRLMDRSQYSSVRLRAYFSRHYDIRVGMYSYGCFDRWRIPPGCRIGRYCSFAKTARVFDAVHPMSALSTSPYFYHPGFGVVTESRLKFTHQVFEDDVWVGHNACITHSCSRIGRGAVIGAGAVVTRDVPPYAIVVGMPAKVVAYRFDPQTIERIERSGWWNLNLEELRKLMKDDPELFFTPGINGDQTVEIA